MRHILGLFHDGL